MAKGAKMKYEIITDHRLNDGYCGSYRYGKPEGIVLHEPANEGLIQNQIGYELRDPANNGIVHAWADDDEIREITNTYYKCWGAGGIANARFVQIEVCRMADKKKAVAAIDRGLFWAAYQLYWYDLACTDATKNGAGTVWTHLAVTKFLGNRIIQTRSLTGRALAFPGILLSLKLRSIMMLSVTGIALLCRRLVKQLILFPKLLRWLLDLLESQSLITQQSQKLAIRLTVIRGEKMDLPNGGTLMI